MRAPELYFDPAEPARAAGSLAEGRLMLPPQLRQPDTRVELSLVWSTADKGPGEGETGASETLYHDPAPPPEVLAFRVWVPWSPWTHDGPAVKIHWTARVTVTVAGFSHAYDRPFAVLPPAPGTVGPDAPYRPGAAAVPVASRGAVGLPRRG